MSKAKKNATVLALICIAAGLAISLAVFSVIGFDVSRLNTMKFETNTYDVTERFSDIRVEGAECDIRLVPSQTGACTVVCTEGEKISHTVTVKDGTLTVTRTDQRRWYERIGVYWGEMSVTVQLPAGAYGNLYIKSVSGGIKVPDGFTFARAEVYSTSGEIDYAADTEQDLILKTTSGELSAGGLAAGTAEVRSTSGDVTIHSVGLRGDLAVETVSGEIGLEGVSAQAASIQSTSGEAKLRNVSTTGRMSVRTASGDVRLTDVAASAPMEVQTVSGEVKLERSDAQTLWIKTTSGDVSGTLLTGKRFVTQTTSGDVRVPDSSPQGGTCEITTVSGDIHINYGNQT